MINRSQIISRNQDFFDVINSQEEIFNQQLDYRITRNTKYVRQYIDLINQEYKKTFDFEEIYNGIDNKDFYSTFLLGVENNQVKGGARLTFSNFAFNDPLPSEVGNFNYSEIFPEYDLNHYNICEISRLTSERNKRNNLEHFRIGMKKVHALFIKNNIKYLLITASRARIRLYNAFLNENFTLLSIKDLNPDSYNSDYRELTVAIYETNQS